MRISDWSSDVCSSDLLHDGSTVYPCVVACLEALQAAGKRTIILSNSGTLRAASMERLARLGIPPALYEDFVTSGEVARSFLAAAPAELRAAGSLGPLHCLPLGSPAGSALMAGLDIIEATSVGEADFLLVASFGQQPPPRDAFDAVLAEARSRGLTQIGRAHV